MNIDHLRYRLLSHITWGKVKKHYKEKWKAVKNGQQIKYKIVHDEKKIFIHIDKSIKELLIVNTDSIGDYILFRNFLHDIKNSEKYCKYKITLLGFEKYREFAEYLDSDVVDTFLWCKTLPQKLSDEELDHMRDDLHNNQGMKYYYDTIIFPSYNSMPKRASHNILISEIIYNEKIINYDNINPHRNANEMLDYTYVHINYNSINMFDFDIYKNFFEAVTESTIQNNYPVIEPKKVIFSYDYILKKNKEYFVINPCAADKFRMWNASNWRKIIYYIKNILNYDVVIVCAKSEENYCKHLVSELDFSVDILSGLPVKNLLAVLKLAKMYIGQDSGIFHVAAALNVRSLCLSAGNAYFRFMNYPKFRKNVKVLFPEGTEEWILKNNDSSPDLVRSVNSFCIDALQIKNVQKAIDDLLSIKEVIFIHKLRTENTGDLVICPYDAFSEYFNNYIVQKYDNEDIKYIKFKSYTFIFGGGGFINQNDFWNQWTNTLIENGSNVIGWSIGFNTHKGKSISIPMKLDDFTLLGIRDIDMGYPWLPCVSCLKKELDIKKTPKRKLGCITHYENRTSAFPCDTIYNNQPFEELISFIAETEVLITNTYHMMYWATLMGKKVLLFDPFSDKFDHFKWQPVRYSGNLEADISNAVTYPESLEECRKLNLEFFEKVKDFLES